MTRMAWWLSWDVAATRGGCRGGGATVVERRRDAAVGCRGLVQVDEEDYYDGPDDSDYETDDSNGICSPFFSRLSLYCYM
ncbi:hypothetical protein RIF29_29804 [Crotalaria pallida]|uniref:Uncharacterized protein n=1 Tax=Crotalaria pallida TaxID=3830 RepID=A0AAN9EFF8_CROPI